MAERKRHQNYEILNLIGYGLAKFDIDLIKNFTFKTKTAFYEYFVDLGIADTIGTIKNRQDLFDPFFDNKRKGWWQKGDAYLHRKIYIDSLFGELHVEGYSTLLRMYLAEKYKLPEKVKISVSPLLKSKFKQLQTTGQEAEMFFLHNFNEIEQFKNGVIEDARLFGDGYDFQVAVDKNFYLTEIKGLRTSYGSIRLTENEFKKAKEYKLEYALVVISNLCDIPKMKPVFNPTEKIKFVFKYVNTRQISYHTKSTIW